jgi:hypothetical protein
MAAHGTGSGQRWQKNLVKVRVMRKSLVQAAIAGNIAAYDHVRMMVLMACTFGILSVHNTVINQEANFRRWFYGQAVIGLPIHRDAAANAARWIHASLTLDVFRDGSGQAMADALMGVRGLGPAKATFSAALLGFTHCPCIDTHMAKAYGLPAQYGSMKKYREAVASSPLVTTVDQWQAFMSVPAFASGQHDCYFDAILSGSVTAVGQWQAALAAAGLTAGAHPTAVTHPAAIAAAAAIVR